MRETVRYHLKFTGIVQGVGFRFTATHEDWERAIKMMEDTAEKYKALGNDEYDLAYSSMMGILDYIESK